MMNVDLYEVFLSYIIYCLLFYFMAILKPFPPPQIFGIYHTRGKEFRKDWPHGFKSEENTETYEWWRVF